MTQYIDHLEDGPWVESIVAEHGLAAVLRACVDVLAEQDPDEVNEVATFLRDIGRRGVVNDELVASVRRRMPASVLPALRRLLRAPVVQARMAAIYTIGKLSFESEATALRAVFPTYVDTDPFCVARLLCELGWLGDRRGVRARLKRIVAHESPWVRWSALGYFGCGGAPPGPELPWLEALSADPVPALRDEARHQLAALELEATGQAANWFPKQKWREQRRTLDRAAPAITFSTLESRFLIEMGRTGRADYSLAELATFAGTLEGAAKRSLA